jgi:hypothetical protein
MKNKNIKTITLEDLKAYTHLTVYMDENIGILNGINPILQRHQNIAKLGCLLIAFCEEGEVPLVVQVSANHVHAVPLGVVVQGVARIISRTRALHVWNVDITDEEGRLISTSRVTNCIKKRKSA